jgi:uncharacterized BrkB/YihY/UPF0761 family membrane protein
MNGKMLVAALALLLGGVFSTATSSIALECYNQNAAFKDSKKENFTFLIVNLASAIVLILFAFACMYFAAQPY